MGSGELIPCFVFFDEKTLESLDVARDFVNPRPWDPWFGGLQGKEDKAAFHGGEGWNRILGCGQCGLERMSPWCLPTVHYKLPELKRLTLFFLIRTLARVVWVVPLLKSQQCLV
uniref:Uncharacterized protein n=1 Tax=Ficedula albicollis TaxID=59894 RepID=A0A803VQF5_FICAL